MKKFIMILMLAAMPIAHVQAMMFKSHTDRAKIALIKSRIDRIGKREAQPIQGNSASHLISDKDFDFSELPKQSNTASDMAIPGSASTNSQQSPAPQTGFGPAAQSKDISPYTTSDRMSDSNSLYTMRLTGNASDVMTPWQIKRASEILRAISLGYYCAENALGFTGVLAHELGHALSSGEAPVNIVLQHYGWASWGGLCTFSPDYCRNMSSYARCKIGMCGPLAGMFATFLQNIGLELIDGYADGRDWKESLKKGLNFPFSWVSDIKKYLTGDFADWKIFLSALKIGRYQAFMRNLMQFIPVEADPSDTDGRQILLALGCDYAVNPYFYDGAQFASDYLIPILYALTSLAQTIKK